MPCILAYSPINAYEVIWPYAIILAFEGHIFAGTYCAIVWYIVVEVY